MRPETTPGMVLGTVGYMSPEQVRGEPADHRTDIFSFGAVFYEMLWGQRAFKRDTAAETMTAILKDDPPELTSGVRSVAPTFDRIVRRCVEKNPEQRFQSASDVAFALDALSGSSASSPAVALAPSRLWWRPLAIGVAVAAASAIGVVVAQQLGARPASVVTFVAKTFDLRPIMNARFMPDGQTIVYSAAPHGYTPDLFVIRPDSEAPQPLGVSKAQLLSVSSKGELAIITNAQIIQWRLFSGTLARMTLGSAPRPMLEHVREADWSPDGSSLAIVHDLGNGRDRLEYPVGTPLHEISGYLSDLRVSPDGNRVAFFEHQWRFDDRGWVKVVDLGGHVTTLAGEYWGMEGLAWTPDGVTIVFSAIDVGGDDLQAMSVPASGRSKALTVFGSPGRFIVYDVARDGRWLATRDDIHGGVRARVPSQSGERDLSWLGSSLVTNMSADGEWLLLLDMGRSAGKNYGVVLRKTDGSQAVRLGEGAAQKLSPDGKWASAIIATPPKLVIYPTGPGQAIRINPGPIELYRSAEWFPDSKRLLACGSEPSRAPRCYVLDVAGSTPKPVTPEGVVGTVAPDGRTLLLTLPDGTFQLASIDGGAVQPVVGLRTEDIRIAWGRDSRSVFVQRGLEVPAIVERVELTTGRRTVVRQVAPEGTGLGSVLTVTVSGWADEGRWYAYTYFGNEATLFVVSGAMAQR
jgi:Tol biopolymer transport system component